MILPRDESSGKFSSTMSFDSTVGVQRCTSLGVVVTVVRYEGSPTGVDYQIRLSLLSESGKTGHVLRVEVVLLRGSRTSSERVLTCHWTPTRIGEKERREVPLGWFTFSFPRRMYDEDEGERNGN